MPESNAGLKRSRESFSVKSSLKGPKKENEKKKSVKLKKYDARTILAQNSDAALKNGQLDVEAFLRSREFEIKALQNGISKAKKCLSQRALQKVPRNLRRRTASHNVKRLPKRLQARGAKEMKDLNTPTVTSNKRKPRTSRGRLRIETAKKLDFLAAKKRESKKNDGRRSNIDTRLPRLRLRMDQINEPPKPNSKFKKRQIHKSWLPTHIWHAKRARMTDPKTPLWRFAIPITPTEKSYRPTHRAGGLRGAIAWDMSYMSTICLEGSVAGLEIFLKKVGVVEKWLWEERGLKWRDGKRSWTGWLSRLVEERLVLICPSTIIWCPPESGSKGEVTTTSTTNPEFSKILKRRIFVRIHPSAFIETWTEFLRLSKLQRPIIHIQDLRFEIGSIDITGPASTETLLGILPPYSQSGEDIEEHAKTFLSLSGLTNPATLPLGAVLSFSIMDPRLRYPPRTINISATSEKQELDFLHQLSKWPVDNSVGSSAIFNRETRFKASHLPSQKAINRRKSLASPGSYPSTTVNDPPIPIVLLASRSKSSPSSQGTWTLLAPWKCILLIWYGLVHYPLSSGGNPRFGGLKELRQIQFEHAEPWFPTDYAGTNSGFSWELGETLIRKSDWEKRPKGKRIEWTSLNLGNRRIGELGRGWSCDYEFLLQNGFTGDKDSVSKDKTEKGENPLNFIQCKDFKMLLSNKLPASPPSNTVATVRIILIGRGVAKVCARIYRLPQVEFTTDSSSSDKSLPTAAIIREQWISLLPPKHSGSNKPAPNPKSKFAKSIGRIPVNTPLPQRVRLLAQSLLQQNSLQYPGEKSNHNGSNTNHPLVPNVEDLMGFVTTGEYCLANGKGAAVGSILISKILDGFLSNLENKNTTSKNIGSRNYTKVCIVRNAGEKIGRLALWEPI